jgi:hypothetical protein
MVCMCISADVFRADAIISWRNLSTCLATLLFLYFCFCLSFFPSSSSYSSSSCSSYSSYSFSSSSSSFSSFRPSSPSSSHILSLHLFLTHTQTQKCRRRRRWARCWAVVGVLALALKTAAAVPMLPFILAYVVRSAIAPSQSIDRGFCRATLRRERPLVK